MTNITSSGLYNNLTVHFLRKNGTKVEVTHRRRYFDPINKRWAFLSAYEYAASELPSFVKPEIRGGTTTVRITVNNKDFIGVSECSKKDAYIRKEGVKFALCRALENAYVANSV